MSVESRTQEVFWVECDNCGEKGPVCLSKMAALNDALSEEMFETTPKGDHLCPKCQEDE